MHVESPWLVILLLPIVALVAWRSRPLEPVGRWLVRGATLLLALAMVGVQVRCDREMRIVALVDVSPSTRGAAYREPLAVDAKLKQLVPNRRVDVRYFADGLVTTPGESMSERTRLPETDADAVIVMSDGRFESPAVLPPVFAVVDAALDAPTDGRIVDAKLAEDVVHVSVNASTASSLSVSGGSSPVAISAGPSTITLVNASSTLTAMLDPLDAWPENNTLAAVAEPERDAKPWIITDASSLPTDPVAYLAPRAIVLPASIELSSVQAERVTQYVRDLGGSLVIVGSPRRIAPAVRSISPLTGVPPTPEHEWILLLDCSGSMATDGRWGRAIEAARDAVTRFEASQRVSIVVFARTAENVAESVTRDEAIARLDALKGRAPTGPTGLEAALQSVAGRTSASPARVLLITDADTTIGSPDVLIKALTKSQTIVFVLATGAAAPDGVLRTIVDQTNGAWVEQADVDQWSRAARSLVDAADGADEITSVPPTTEGVLAGLTLEAERLYRAFPRSDVQTLARTDEHTIAATWQVGLGRVTSIAADLPRASLERVADRLKRSPRDPRFTVTWGADSVVLTASNTTTRLNGLQPAVVLNGQQVVMEQIAPGRYEAPLARSGSPRVARVVLNDSVVATRALPGRYQREFDWIGNDREALARLADRTGGAVIEAGQVTPITLARATSWRSIAPALAMSGVLLLGAAIVMIRAPYLPDRLRRYARRSVR